MAAQPPRGLFITATNTEVGKTYVAAQIARALVAAGNRTAVYKPVASGCRPVDGKIVADDAVALWEAAGQPGTLDQVCPQKFLAPLAPHVAAREEGRSVDATQLREGIAAWSDYDIVVIEGVGGLMSPISDDDYNASLAEEFGYPLVVVVPNELGVINQSLQTLITAASWGNGLPVAGIVLNNCQQIEGDVSTGSNRQELEARCVPPVLAEVAHAGGFDTEVDWFALAAPEA